MCPIVQKLKKVTRIYIIHISILVSLFIWNWNIQAAEKSFTVVIDAGHGGKDPGAKGTIINEKAINLGIALKLGKLITRNHQDVKVVYTRSSDKFVELDERANIANRCKADLFISIHTNAVAKGNSAHGTETYTLGLARTDENLEVAMRENAVILLEEDYQQRYEGFDPNSTESYIIFEFIQNKHMEQSIGFASEIQKNFTSAKREDRGVRQAGFLVLRKTSMPSVLIEVGFITNRSEERYLASERGQQQLALSISNAFDNYKRALDNRQVATLARSSTEENAPIASHTDEVLPPAGSEEDILRRKKARQAAEQERQADDEKNKIVYKIQILTSKEKLPANSRLLKGYKNVECVKGRNFYKYYYGKSTRFNEISRLRKRVIKDFKDAYIVVFKNGKEVKQ